MRRIMRRQCMRNSHILNQASTDGLRPSVRSSTPVHDLSQYARPPSKSVHEVDGPDKNLVHLRPLTRKNSCPPSKSVHEMDENLGYIRPPSMRTSGPMDGPQTVVRVRGGLCSTGDNEAVKSSVLVLAD